MALSDRVQIQTFKIDGKRACHACGKREEREESLHKCARCNLSWYCDKVWLPIMYANSEILTLSRYANRLDGTRRVIKRTARS
jgi:hypothetical protein